MVERGVKFLCVPAVPVMSWVGGYFFEEEGGGCLRASPGAEGRGYSDVNTDKKVEPAGWGLSLEEQVKTITTTGVAAAGINPIDADSALL